MLKKQHKTRVEKEEFQMDSRRLSNVSRRLATQLLRKIMSLWINTKSMDFQRILHIQIVALHYNLAYYNLP